MDHRFLRRSDSSYQRRAGTSSCISPDPTSNLTTRLNQMLSSSGSGYILSLCPGQQYPITAPLLFTSPNQEISTQGYPTGSDRATLVVNGPVFSNGTGHSTAVDGTCANCDGVTLRNVQINGTRLGAPPINGGANIEMGAGSDLFQQWADGISVSCRNSLVRNNMINNPTDGGIVLFGSPGTRVENNTIWVESNTLLGGINMVDYNPFSGNYSGVVVTNNTIVGGFADGTPSGSQTKGTNNEDVIIKSVDLPPSELGLPLGHGLGLETSTVTTTSPSRITFLIGNTSFIGARGPNCTANDPTPSPAPFVIDLNTTTQSTTQSNFTPVADGDSLTCVLPPDGGDYWPFGGNPSTSPSPSSSSTPSSSHLSTGTTVGIILGSIAAVVAVAVLALRAEARKLVNSNGLIF
ncbi:hypothetical protein BKA82DRAFT_993417 [Pisolithus tinctorius]|nr:hypothetical protein BKA82DRAFT_993417 [Pisolithus tinctorius]